MNHASVITFEEEFLQEKCANFTCYTNFVHLSAQSKSGTYLHSWPKHLKLISGPEDSYFSFLEFWFQPNLKIQRMDGDELENWMISNLSDPAEPSLKALLLPNGIGFSSWKETFSVMKEVVFAQ